MSPVSWASAGAQVRHTQSSSVCYTPPFLLLCSSSHDSRDYVSRTSATRLMTQEQQTQSHAACLSRSLPVCLALCLSPAASLSQSSCLGKTKVSDRHGDNYRRRHLAPCYPVITDPGVSLNCRAVHVKPDSRLPVGSSPPPHSPWQASALNLNPPMCTLTVL